MNIPVMDFLQDLFRRYLVEVVLILSTGLWWAFRGRLKHKDATIHRLREDIERRDIELDAKEREVTAMRDRCSELERMSPQVALERVERELLDNNDGPAHRAIVDWFDSEGETVSMLLFHRAEWTTARAAGEARAMGLVAAHAYAVASLAMFPQRLEVRQLVADLELLLRDEQHSSPSTANSLAEFDNRASELFNSDLMAAAEVAEEEAWRRYRLVSRSASLLVANLSLNLYRQSLGSRSVRTHGLQRLRAALVDDLGNSSQALLIAQELADAQASHPKLGPHHPATMMSRYLVAQIQNKLGRSEEALLIAQDVAGAQVIHPDLGSSHPDTLVTRYLVARILFSLKRSDEALPILQDVAGAQAAHPDLGPNHPDTLSSRNLIALILDSLGRSEEALSMIQEVADAKATHMPRGPNHPNTLASRAHAAQMLFRMGRSDEALPMIQGVADAEASHPDLGPNHQETLMSRVLLAQVLHSLGRSDEALTILQGVADAQASHPGLGPNHPNTLASQHLAAQILQCLKKRE